MVEYVGTISKLKKELTTLKSELTEKSKEEERLKDHMRRLEENESAFTKQVNVNENPNS